MSAKSETPPASGAADAAAPAAGKAPSKLGALLPVILVVVLAPAVSWAVAQFVLLPQLKAELIKAFPAEAAGAALQALQLAPAEWGLMYYGAGPCGVDCVKTIELLTTIRGLVGAQGARVHVVALVDAAPAQSIDQALTIADAGARALLAREVAARTGVAREHGIVIVDSQRFAMMVFSTDAEPAGIKEDLKRLLRGSSIN